MAEAYINDSGSWRNIKSVYVNDSGSWRPIRNIYVNDGGTWRLVFGGNTGTASWTTAQTTTWTVPNGVYSISVNACGGSGGGGQADGGTNFNGYGGAGGGANLKGAQSFSVTPGQVISITVGGGGPANAGQSVYGGQSIVSGTGVAYTADGGQCGANYSGGVSAFAGMGAYGADYPSSSYSRTYSPGVSYNGGSDGGRGGNAPNYTPGLPGNPGKVYISY